jgi:hypothetical protein
MMRNFTYTVIDMHAVPGCQNQDWHSDNPTPVAAFWQHPHFQDGPVHLAPSSSLPTDRNVFFWNVQPAMIGRPVRAFDRFVDLSDSPSRDVPSMTAVRKVQSRQLRGRWEDRRRGA